LVEVIGRRWAGQSFREIARRTHLGLGTVVRAHRQAIEALGAFQNPIAANVRTVTDDEYRVGITQTRGSFRASDAGEI
jgi:hypothetical protein